MGECFTRACVRDHCEQSGQDILPRNTPRAKRLPAIQPRERTVAPCSDPSFTTRDLPILQHVCP